MRETLMVKDPDWDEVIPLADNWKLFKDAIGNTYLAYNHGDFHSVMYIGLMDIPENSTLETAINMLRSQGEITTRTQ
jgi:hypothetical protein